MKKVFRLRYVVLFLVFLLIALIRFPAGIAARFLPAPLVLQGASGTLWNGQASAFGVDGIVIQQNVRWQWQASALLRAALVWDIQGNFLDKNSQLLLEAGVGQISLRNLKVSLPLEPLTRMAERAKSLRLGALITLESPLIALNKNWVLDGQIDNLSSALTPSSNPFGSYRIHLDIKESGQGEWQLSTLNGALKADGQGALVLAKPQLTGSIKLIPDEEALVQLKPILGMLSRAESAYVLDIN